MRRKRKPKKGKKGEKAPTTTPGKVKRLVEWMIRHADKKTDLPSDRLFHFFQTQILAFSAKFGLLGDMNALTAAGDGTPIVTSAFTRSKSTCNCHAQALLTATILVSTSNPTAMRAGTAPERSTLTVTIST